MQQAITTDALVVGWRPSSESAAVITLFTRDLGLVQAIARGIRFERSKLRYYVQLYSYAIVTLVPGREHYVLIGAVESARCKLASTRTKAHIAALLSRFLGEHDPHEELFDTIVDLLEKEDHENIETTLSLRTLESLGYIARTPVSAEDAGLLIEQAVRESHL